MFITMDTCMDTLEFPITRKIAAPALYRATKGMDAATISRYTSAYPRTSAVICPKTVCRTKFLATYRTAITPMARIPKNQINC